MIPSRRSIDVAANATVPSEPEIGTAAPDNAPANSRANHADHD
jgi:hypothetical protein